jgi:hypothetical protein
MKEIKIAVVHASTLSELKSRYEDFKNILTVEITVNKISVDWFEMMIIYKEI